MKITSKGQVTIPVELREKTGLLPGTRVQFELDESGVRIVKAHQGKEGGRREEVLKRLRGSATVQMTTDEIMALTRE